MRGQIVEDDCENIAENRKIECCHALERFRRGSGHALAMLWRGSGEAPERGVLTTAGEGFHSGVVLVLDWGGAVGLPHAG